MPTATKTTRRSFPRLELPQPDDLIWENPPTTPDTVNRRSRISPVIKALRERPGDWLRVTWSRQPSSYASYVNQGKGAYHPAGAFEAVVRRDTNGEGTCYVRFQGDWDADLAESA